VAVYCAGRLWIEALRIDSAHRILGLRLNLWTSVIVLIGAVAFLVLSGRLRPGREAVLLRTAEEGLEAPSKG
jgi:prolipoprotein diacylglyceryltransferase